MRFALPFLVAVYWFAQPVLAQDDEMEDRWVVILSACKTFAEAKEDAVKFAKATGVPFSMRSMIYDRKGLRYPDDFEHEAHAGEYAVRRYNYAVEGEKTLEDFISIEKSDAYPGFAPGYYIVVASVEESKAAAEKQVKRFKAAAKQAYAKKTRLFMGCTS